MSQDDAAGLHAKLDALAEAFSRHEGRESEWQVNVETKLDAHIKAQDESDNRWRTGWVGLFFTLVGGAILGVWQWVSTRH